MKIIFFGSSHFAVSSLEALIKSKHEVLCVITQPDKKKGRRMLVSGTDIKTLATKAKLKIFQPENINNKESIKFLKNLEADLFVIVAYGQIFSQEVLDIPKIMPLNIHASLLPRYRGAAPINWAIINGDKKTGVTIMFVSAKMDSGPILAQQEIKIENTDTSISLAEKLSKAGAQLLIESLAQINNKNYRLIDQDEEHVIYAPKMKKEDGQIDWSTPAADIYNQIRGVLPWPGAFSSYRGKILKIFQADLLPIFPNHKPLAGEVVKADKGSIVVACARGFLEIKELQLEAGKRMSAKNFIIGHKLSVGEILGKK